MNPAIPATPRQPAVPSEQLPIQEGRDNAAGVPATGAPNPAQTDDSPDAILDYN